MFSSTNIGLSTSVSSDPDDVDVCSDATDVYVYVWLRSSARRIIKETVWISGRNTQLTNLFMQVAGSTHSARGMFYSPASGR